MQKYLCFPLAKALDSLVGQKIQKKPILNFPHFSLISSKSFKSDKSDTKNPKKQSPHVIKLKILNFQVQTIGKKRFCKQILKSVKDEEKNNEN